MHSRFSYLPLFLSFALLASAKDKNDKNKDKGTLPDYVLHAQTIQVIVSPDASDSLDHPMANARAREDVERALQAWGRFTLVAEGQSDLVITVRAGTGRLVSPAIERGPVDNKIGTVQPSGGSIGIDAQQGRVPADSDPGVPVHTGPHIGNEIGRANDTFEVYRGGIAYPLHSSPLWQYTAKDALKAPSVPAVEQFRKAIAATEKKQNKP